MTLYKQLNIIFIIIFYVYTMYRSFCMEEKLLQFLKVLRIYDKPVSIVHNKNVNLFRSSVRLIMPCKVPFTFLFGSNLIFRFILTLGTRNCSKEFRCLSLIIIFLCKDAPYLSKTVRFRLLNWPLYWDEITGVTNSC